LRPQVRVNTGHHFRHVIAQEHRGGDPHQVGLASIIVCPTLSYDVCLVVDVASGSADSERVGMRCVAMYCQGPLLMVKEPRRQSQSDASRLARQRAYISPACCGRHTLTPASTRDSR
jgi:hypothetical protein